MAGLQDTALTGDVILAGGESAITFGRKTEIVYNLDDVHVEEVAWTGGRSRGSLPPPSTSLNFLAGGTIPTETSGTPLVTDWDVRAFRRWKSGAISLRPVQMEMSFYQEAWTFIQGSGGGAGLGLNRVLTADKWNMPHYDPPAGSGSTAPVPMWTEFYASGRAARPGMDAVPPSFPVMRKDIPAGGHYDKALDDTSYKGPAPSLFPHASAFAGAPIPGMYRVLESKDTFPSDEGFLFFFDLMSAQHDNPFQLFTFYFGGYYALSIMGNGTAILWRCFKATPGIDDWTIVHQFRYAQQKDVGDKAHHIIIWPNNHIIHIVCDSNDTVGFVGNDPTGERDIPDNVSQYETAYTKSQHELDYDLGGPGTAYRTTLPGPVRVDLAKDLRCNFHCSRLAYPVAANYIETPYSIPFATSTTRKLSAQWVGIWDGGVTTDLQLRLLVITNNPPFTDPLWTATLVNPNSDGTFNLPGGANMFYPVWTFKSLDGAHTPILYSTEYDKPAVIGVDAGTNILVNSDSIGHISLSGAGTDPSHETASFAIHDYRNQVGRHITGHDFVPYLIRLKLESAHSGRHILPASVKNPPSGVGYCILHRGYTRKSRGTVKPPNDFSGGLPWMDIAGTGVGQWERLAEYVSLRRKNYGADPLDVSKPWKVTDVLKDLFKEVGIGAAAFDCPDLNIRLWGGNQAGSVYELEPNTNLMQRALGLCQDYLGGWIEPEPNLAYAGAPYGVWRVLAPPAIGTPSVASLYMDWGNPSHIGFRPEGEEGVTFLETCEAYTEAPEGTAICVIGDTAEDRPGAGNAVKTQWMVNPNGFRNAVPGVTANRDSPDWRGTFVPIRIGDTTIQDQATLNFMTARYFDYVCRGRQFLIGTAPLLLVQEEYQGSITALNGKLFLRPLRIYDVVTVNGVDCYVKSCSIDYGKDNAQRMMLELQIIWSDCQQATRTNPLNAIFS